MFGKDTKNIPVILEASHSTRSDALNPYAVSSYQSQEPPLTSRMQIAKNFFLTSLTYERFEYVIIGLTFISSGIIGAGTIGKGLFEHASMSWVVEIMKLSAMVLAFGLFPFWILLFSVILFRLARSAYRLTFWILRSGKRITAMSLHLILRTTRVYSP